MTDTKGSALPHPASLATTDLVLVVTTPGGTPASQSITFANLLKSGYSLSTFSDANYTAVATDTIVGQTGTLTAARVVTLPAANAVPAGYELIVCDMSGSVTATNTITLQRAGSDTLNGSTSVAINSAYGARRLISNGSNKWTFDAGVLRTSNNLSDVASVSTARTNLGLDVISTCKSNLGSTTDPGTGNDNTQGYAIGSVWVNTSNNMAWICTNASTGAAKWAKDSPALPDVQLFTSSGTWAKPAGAAVVMLYLIGAGGGGGAGRRGAAGTVRCGGGGGGGGALTILTYPASAFSSSETVTIGAGGSGAATQTVDSTDGSAGGFGAVSYFKGLNYARASAGSPGSGGTASTGSGGAAGSGTTVGATGASASTTGGAGLAGISAIHAGCSGGSGGGISSGDVEGAGGAGSGWPSAAGGGSGSAGGAAGGNNPGPNGAAISSVASTYTMTGGQGGGGGGASKTTAAGAGGNGGKYGAGGGGGGASLNGFASGAGGNGADGVVLVISY